MSTHPGRLATANRRLLLRLAVSAVVMFGFGFLLVPFYEKICEVTGINNFLRPEAEPGFAVFVFPSEQRMSPRLKIERKRRRIVHLGVPAVTQRTLGQRQHRVLVIKLARLSAGDGLLHLAHSERVVIAYPPRGQR